MKWKPLESTDLQWKPLHITSLHVVSIGKLWIPVVPYLSAVSTGTESGTGESASTIIAATVSCVASYAVLEVWGVRGVQPP